MVGERREGMTAEAYVRQSIIDPGAYVLPGYSDVEMPPLSLDRAQIEGLVAFLLAQRT